MAGQDLSPSRLLHYTYLLIFVMGTTQSAANLVGVSYGMLGNNLPPPAEVVNLYMSNNIRAMRLYSPNQATLQALKGSSIQLILNVETDLQSLAVIPSAATTWVQNNVLKYWPDVSFRYIAVGNEAIPGDKAQYVLPAMCNIQSALSEAGLRDQIKVSTSVSTSHVLSASYPPSAGTFSSAAKPYMGSIVQFLEAFGSPLLVNVFPYSSYVNTPEIDIQYALFTSPDIKVRDGPYIYQNLFDAILDATYAALDKVDGEKIPIVVSESGWPSAGETAATVSNAQTYNQNLIRHVANVGSTPRRPQNPLEVYIFAMFNENEKSPGIEQNWGLFYPDMQPVYNIDF